VSCLLHIIQCIRSFLSSGDKPLASRGRELPAFMMENSFETGLSINYDIFQIWNTYLNKCKKETLIYFLYRE
jgi:hypothetical protein